MGQTLTNGIFLPNEGERNCYTGLANNWRAIDGYIGGYNVHVADAFIHVSQADRDKWDAVDNKADASALTAHTGNTTIHVTAADKEAWNAVTSKADDDAVVHKSGAETIGGVKTFTSNLLIYNSDTSAYASYLNLKNQRITRGSSVIGSQGIQYQDKNNKTLTLLESRIVGNGNTVFNIACYNIDGNNQPVSDGVSVIKSSTTTSFAPTTDNAVTSGRTLAKWSDVQTYKVNTLEPSSLSLPSDRSARVDISSYFTNTGTGQSNSYTVPANGYIYLTLSELTNIHCFSRTSGNITNYAQTFTKLSNSTGTLYVLFPVRKNDVFVATWYTTTTVRVDGAFFIPCQGNI